MHPPTPEAPAWRLLQPSRHPCNRLLQPSRHPCNRLRRSRFSLGHHQHTLDRRPHRSHHRPPSTTPLSRSRLRPCRPPSRRTRPFVLCTMASGSYIWPPPSCSSPYVLPPTRPLLMARSASAYVGASPARSSASNPPAASPLPSQPAACPFVCGSHSSTRVSLVRAAAIS